MPNSNERKLTFDMRAFQYFKQWLISENWNSHHQCHSMRQNKSILTNTDIDIEPQVSLTDIRRRRRRRKETHCHCDAYVLCMFMQNIPSCFALCDVFISIQRIKIHSNFSGSSPKLSKQKVKRNESLIHSMRKNEPKQKIIEIQIAMINFTDKPVRVLVTLI